MTVQFVETRFVESYYPTIENTFSRTIKLKGQEYATEIIDTAGQVCCCPNYFRRPLLQSTQVAGLLVRERAPSSGRIELLAAR